MSSEQSRSVVISIQQNTWSNFVTDQGTGNRVSDLTSGADVDGDNTYWYIQSKEAFKKSATNSNTATGAAALTELE